MCRDTDVASAAQPRALAVIATTAPRQQSTLSPVLHVSLFEQPICATAAIGDEGAVEPWPGLPVRDQTLARALCAAATMCSIARFTSGHVRVLSPQSGLTQIWSAARRRAAAWSNFVISLMAGTRGEWMS